MLMVRVRLCSFKGPAFFYFVALRIVGSAVQLLTALTIVFLLTTQPLHLLIVR